MASTMKPTGLAIARSTTTMEFSWKFGQAYTKQEYKYSFDGKYPKTVGTSETYNGYIAVNDGSTSSAAVTIPTTALIPTANQKTKCTAFTVQVRGYASSTGKWSEWVKLTYKFIIPNDATLERSGMDVIPHVVTDYNSGKGDPYLSDIEYEVLLSTVVAQKNVKWSDTGTGTKSGSYQTGTLSNNQTLTLPDSQGWITWFRCRPRGIAGTAKNYTYASAKKTVPIAVTAVSASMAGLNVTAKWTPHNTQENPTDTFEVYYTIATPTSGMACPSGATWTLGQGGIVNTAKTATFAVSQRPGTDQCLWVKVKSIYSPYEAESEIVLAQAGKLVAPTVNTVTVDPSTKSAVITWTNNTTVPDAKTAITFMDGSVLGTFAHGVTSGTVTYKGRGEVQFGVYAFQGTSATKTNMRSDTAYITAVDKPLPPNNISATAAAKAGTVVLTWANPWTDADGTEISYADHDDAWESTDEPTRYEINERKTGWNVAGLETGKKWYIKLRSIGEDDEGERAFSPYSDMTVVDLASAPEKPVVFVSDSVIEDDETLTISWTFTSTDGTDQRQAEIYDREYQRTDQFTGDGMRTAFSIDLFANNPSKVTIDGVTTAAYTKSSNVITFTSAPPKDSAIAITYTLAASAQRQLDIVNSNSLSWSGVPGWKEGSVHMITVRCTSESNYRSNESVPVYVRVAPRPAVHTLKDAISTGITGGVLTELPITMNVIGAGTGGTTAILIKRIGDYHMERPDESMMDGFDGETIFSTSYPGERTITIEQKDLIGSLDDGATYQIVATVTDEVGQTAKAVEEFKVAWSHQASAPTATASASGLTASVKATAPSSYLAGDVVDIYRLSADRPELIVRDGAFGKTYIDPYPACGGGYRCVHRTYNGDYIDGTTNRAAWVDVPITLKFTGLIIDFGQEQVQLPFNVTLSNAWQKEFKETKYLSGHIQGDWNAGTSRTATINASISASDSATIELMRRLSVYEGICHVRTFDGSSFTADVEVTEGRQGVEKTITFDLSITRVDPVVYIGRDPDEYGAHES